MFLKWNHESIRITGRWDRRSEDTVTTTNTGCTIEIAYYGKMAILHFDVETNEEPRPLLWIQVDSGTRVEVTLEPYIHVQTMENTDKMHILKIVYKSALEHQNRWYLPLTGKVSFRGVDVEKPCEIPLDTRKTIEFIGDSITEGVLTDPDCGKDCIATLDWHDLVYQNDACATYAWLTSEKLNLRSRIMGYGGTGVTTSGSGNVPKAASAYPYIYDGCPLKESEPDFIIINHGANDSTYAVEEYTSGYLELLKVIRGTNPNSRIFCLSAFMGVYPVDLKGVINSFNTLYNDSVIFIDSTGWVPPDPVHPLREGHMIIAEKLTEILRPYMYL